MKNQGYATKYPNFQDINLFDGSLFDFRCIPLITEVSNNIGSPKGQILTIKGYGFNVSSSLKVTAGDYPCTVISSDIYTITCRVGETPLNQALFLKGSGIEKFLYNGNIGLSNGQFAAMFWANNVTLPLQKYSIENSLERIPTDDRFFLPFLDLK